MKRFMLIVLIASGVAIHAEENADNQSQKTDAPPAEITVPVKGGTMKLNRAERPGMSRNISANSDFDAEQMKKDFLEIKNLSEMLKNKLRNFKANYGMSIDVQVEHEMESFPSMMPSRRMMPPRMMDKNSQTSPEAGKENPPTQQ